MLGPDRPVFGPRPAATSGSKLVQPDPQQQQLMLVRQFVARVGGLENARRALELLAILKRAA
jgi:hypothetical protein